MVTKDILRCPVRNSDFPKSYNPQNNKAWNMAFLNCLFELHLKNLRPPFHIMLLKSEFLFRQQQVDLIMRALLSI